MSPPPDDDESAARRFAEERHAAQRYGDAPYSRHLGHVRAVLDGFGYHGALAVAAWLHDTVEDTGTTRDEIAARFGGEVAALVWAVTGVGPDRHARNLDAYAKIRAHPPAAVLKLADRIANVEASVARPDKLALYASEFDSFGAALAGLGDQRMWVKLRALLGR